MKDARYVSKTISGKNRERCLEYSRQYYQTHRESCAKRRKNKREATRQRQLDYFHSEKKRTEEKLKALGPQKRTVILTDYLKSPSVDLRTPVATYFESFCQSLDVEGDDISFVDTLNQQNMDQMTMMNLDSGQISTMDEHVWDRDVNQWLDELIAELEDPSSLENTVDVNDLFYDMTPDDWEHLVDDVINHFGVDLLS